MPRLTNYSEKSDCMIAHSGPHLWVSTIHRLAFLTSLRSSREVEDEKEPVFSVMATAVTAYDRTSSRPASVYYLTIRGGLPFRRRLFVELKHPIIMHNAGGLSLGSNRIQEPTMDSLGND
jgi:hypothetical protein